MSILQDTAAIQVYIKTASQTYGPYPSKAVAEAIMPSLNLQESAQIISTVQGKEILFG